MLLRGIGERWSEECILGAIKCDHGYSRHSTSVQYFVRVLTELSSDEQRAFLRFVTGSPRLPYGGIAALRPRLTIVKKHSGSSPPVSFDVVYSRWRHALVPSACSTCHHCHCHMQVMMRMALMTKSYPVS